MSGVGIVHPEGWAPARGYASGVIASGRILFVAGQIGWNPATGEFESDDFVMQTAQALRNVADVLSAGGAEPARVTRLTWYITDREAYLASAKEIGVAYRAVFGRHFPAMSVVVVAGLLEPRAKVEIEATAVMGEG
ncbi:MAG: RidA family protein [Gemmatimonadota bacterium]|nr:RidA family protein [Gemmatimonadota bacterium]